LLGSEKVNKLEFWEECALFLSTVWVCFTPIFDVRIK
jgi:hypothetical protein